MTEKKYSIGVVSKRLDLPQSVLRYWESVFSRLNPEKTPGGTRKYSEADIQLILNIKDLLYEKKFTIAGAQVFLEQKPSLTTSEEDKKISQYVIKELESILRELES